MVNQRLLNTLTEVEQRLVAETERDALKALDEDELLELHQRIRRTRTKYVKNYRRAASGKVSERGGRGMSYAQNQRDRDKAELFESVLARVSRAVAVSASRAAAELKTQRIEQARATKAAAPVDGHPEPADLTATASQRRKATKTTGGLKKDASTRSLGATRQAKRDSR